MDKISITICGDGGCEDSYSVTRNVDGLPYFLSITDTAGQEEYRGLWTASTLKSDAFLLVYDITNPSSLETLDHFMDMINMEAEQRVEDNERLRKEFGRQDPGTQVGMPPPVKILAGNKCDLKDDRAVTSRDGLEYARKHGCGFMETSAREMVNIEETFSPRLTVVDLVRRVIEARRVHCQPDTPQPPQCAEPIPTTALPPTTVDATTEGRTRTRVWRLFQCRKTTEPREDQGSSAMATEKQTKTRGFCCFR
ncbi:uncharacterized protein N7511_004038 [Penicillium nucicola]|uniref:uncharacterized protein n=1 Tax=Penicillium nucicola TaxID=1850975 RepID=UPI002544DC30|nr:uncharacterized protein N7511_004038 [Penicillium nucicola]KAJ5766422.1 hypothetical protein N7511_004038 [Penicillium nucicola]